MPYRAPLAEYRYLLDHVTDYGRLADTAHFAEATPDLTEAILTEAAKLCEEVMAPLQRVGDLEGSRLENGVVRTPTGYAEAFRAIAEGGWIGMSAGAEHGGMGLPVTLAMAVNEMMSGACLALQLNPLMIQGQIEALEHHASDELKALYLPRLISGDWTGTMNLTEPQAGSDVGALATRAEPNGDGSYAITGQKIFISWGDHDMTENVVHLVLARLPDGVPGTKGISLFLVPKIIPDADGSLGRPNDLRVVSLEHKLGLHGSPTAVMAYEGATGWLVGPEHGGMAAMFTMMNNARLGVATQGIGAAEGAYQHALAFAMERKQGRVGGTGTIVEHADVRRMLAEMKAQILAARAIELMCATAIDMERATGEAAWAARAAFLTPIAKAFGTDTGIEVASKGIQIHGGMGYIEESGAAQYLRDARVTAIYEGTNGIQAMDLVGRKLRDGGEAAYALIDEVCDCSEAARGAEPELAAAVWNAAESLREATEWMVARTDAGDRNAGAVPYLRAFALVIGGCAHLKSAIAGDDARLRLARFYIERMLPEHAALLAHATAGAAGLMALTPDELIA